MNFKQTKYFDNLKVSGNDIYSYDTLVATIDTEKNEVVYSRKWSLTTSKHINYVAKELGYKVIQG